jgi:hypothetical protein
MGMPSEIKDPSSPLVIPVKNGKGLTRGLYRIDAVR